MKAVILAAGLGTRLGNSLPKVLTELSNGTSILQHQLNAITRFLSIHDVYVVVGHKKEFVMDASPRVSFVYNQRFAKTNTAKSLLCALEKFDNEDVVWLNGDVVCDAEVIHRVIAQPGSCVAVNTSRVSDEEVKYLVSESGLISEISKEVVGGAGEAVGVNKIAASGLSLFRDNLRVCSDTSYFEKGMEQAIKGGLEVSPVDISDLFCVEIDFPEDLKRVNDYINYRRRTPLAAAAGIASSPQYGFSD